MKNRTMNGKYSTIEKTMKEKLLPVKILTLSLCFTYGFSLSPKIFSYFQVQAEEVSTVAGQTLPLATLTPEIVEVVPKLSEKQQILSYIVEVFGDKSDAAIAMVYKCENSTFDQTRVNHNSNGTTDHGIFQINSIHEKRYGSAFKTDWKANVDVAFEIYKSAGYSFRPWTCAHIAGEVNYLGQK